MKKLYPIITIVIYYSHKKWKSPKSLHDLILIEDNNILKYIPDYKLNLIEPYSMEDEDFNKLNNDLRLLFEFIKYSGNQNKLDLLLNNNDKYKAIDIKTARLIKEITKIDIEIDEEDGGEYNMCKAIEDMKKTSYKQGVKDTEETMCKAIEDMKKTARREGIEEGKASMCKAIEDMKKTARREGIEEGKVKGKAEGIVEGETIATTNNIKTMHKNGFDIETIARALSLDINYIKAILNA